MQRIHLLLLLAFFGLGTISQSHGQCRLFTKKSCIPNLDPYISNGQFNGATLFEGESASLLQTFYSGQDYRLLVCAHEALDQVFFEVKDSGGKLLFSSKDKEQYHWDFNVASTQQLTIDVFIPDSGGNSTLKKNGCVSIMVGFK